MSESGMALHPDFFEQLAATNPFEGRARRLFERGQVVSVNGNQAEVQVGLDSRGNPLVLRQVPIVSGYAPRAGDWVAIQYEAGHSGAPCVIGPSMAAEASDDPPGIGIFSVSSAAPSNPQKSTIYFDDSLASWRGWDGVEWVDFTGKLHNSLPDLQGGAAGEHYHFTTNEHEALQDLYDGSAMASSYIKQLNFKAIDASATERTHLFERDGDFYLAVNAQYDSASGNWNRVDTAKYAYHVAFHSKNSIPTEPVGGLAWWRAVPAANPIGEWAMVGGWELGFMMTQDRNFVMGGMNLEMDGAGTPPYGRFTQIGANDAATSGLTALQRNTWYEGLDSWGRDEATKNAALLGFDQNADLVLWWYPDSGEGAAPFATSAWHKRAIWHLSGNIRGRLDAIRASSETAIGNSAFLSKHKTSSDMVDGFGAGYAWAIEDNAGVENIIGAMYGVRNGADNTGKFSWQLASAGSLAERMSLTAAGVLRIYGDITNEDYFKLTSTRDAWSGGSLTSEIRLGAFCVSGNWPVVYFNGHYNSGDKYTISDSAFQVVHNLNTDLLHFRTAAAGTAGNAITYHIAISLGDSGSASKVGFFGATPVVRPTHVTDADGTLASATTAINAVISRLEALGLFASS